MSAPFCPILVAANNNIIDETCRCMGWQCGYYVDNECSRVAIVKLLRKLIEKLEEMIES